jgi:RNase P subunit RPR2
VPDDSQQGPWYFGVTCENCGWFIAVGRDPSEGRPGARYAGAGTVIATCTSCGHRGRYAVAKVEQRRAERRPQAR